MTSNFIFIFVLPIKVRVALQGIGCTQPVMEGRLKAVLEGNVAKVNQMYRPNQPEGGGRLGSHKYELPRL